MKFNVCHKGIQRFSGTLAHAMRYVEDQWGTVSKAYAIGVKLVPVPATR